MGLVPVELHTDLPGKIADPRPIHLSLELGSGRSLGVRQPRPLLMIDPELLQAVLLPFRRSLLAGQSTVLQSAGIHHDGDGDKINIKAKSCNTGLPRSCCLYEGSPVHMTV